MPMSPTFDPIYCGTSEAAARLGYASLDTFRDHLKLGYIGGAERHGDGPRPRWRFRVAELAYVGPRKNVADQAERLEAERLARLDAVRPAAGRANPFLRSRRAAA